MNEMLENYRVMLKGHDWFFHYSDDHRYYTRGMEQSKALDKAYAQLSAEGFEVEAREMFNELSPDGFHMKEPK